MLFFRREDGASFFIIFWYLPTNFYTISKSRKITSSTLPCWENLKFHKIVLFPYIVLLFPIYFSPSLPLHSVSLFYLFSFLFVSFFLSCPLKMTAFQDIAPCSLVEIYHIFRGTYWLHHQGDQGNDGGSTYPSNVGLLQRV
jgi:hypothetical protein